MNQLKDVSFWTEDDVESLPLGEFDWLELKSSKKFTEGNWEADISKYLSAWANYDGGYLVIGVEDPNPGTPLQIDGGVPLKCKKDLATWLDQMLPNLVEPPLPKITTKLIGCTREHSKIERDRVLIVIHVPPSESAPHQARDHKYYQRLGRNLSPLRHRHVLDIQSRRKHPVIVPEIIVHIGKVSKPTLFWRLKNIGAAGAKDWLVVIQFPTCIGKTEIRIEDNHHIDENDPSGSFWELRQGRGLRQPLFPGSDVSGTYQLVPCKLLGRSKSIKEVRVTIFANDMPAKKAVFDLKDVLREH
jgi:hypothetical protein